MLYYLMLFDLITLPFEKFLVGKLDCDTNVLESCVLIIAAAQRHHYLRVSLTDRCNLKCQLAASRYEAFQSSESGRSTRVSNWNSCTFFAYGSIRFCACKRNTSLA